MGFWFIQRYGLLELFKHRGLLGFLWLGVVLHVQLGVQLDQPGGLLAQFVLLREGFLQLLAGILDLTLKVGEARVETAQLLVQRRQRVFNAAYVAPRIRAQLDVVLKPSLEREDVLAELFKGDLYIEAPEGANVNGLCVLHRGQDIQKCFARGDALVVVQPLELDTGKAVRGRGMGVARGDVHLAAQDCHSRRGYLAREVLHQPVLKLVLLALVAVLEQTQLGDLHVQVMR